MSSTPPTASPEVLRSFVCAGAGGVGKTTTSAALAVALARSGKRTLVVTTDPARRLADALGVRLGNQVQQVSLDGAAIPLFALMPDPAASGDAFASLLFVDDAVGKERLAANPIYQTLCDSTAGMHEVVAFTLLAGALLEAKYDAVVVDTAPSRNALDFLSYPRRLASFMDGRALGWLASLEGSRNADKPGLFASVEKRIESVFQRILNPKVLGDLGHLFKDLLSVRVRFKALAELADRILLGPKSSFIVVVAPTETAVIDAQFLAGKVRGLKKSLDYLILNRGDSALPSWALSAQLLLKDDVAVQHLVGELEARTRDANLAALQIARAIPAVPVIRLATHESTDAKIVVEALAAELEKTEVLKASR